MYVESRLLEERQTLDIDVQTVLAQCFQDDVGTDARNHHMLRVEHLGSFHGIPLVVANGTMAHDERIDAQVERCLACRVSRGQRVEHELEVGRSVLCHLIQGKPCSENLCRRDGDTSYSQWRHINLGRHAGHFQHLLLALVVNDYIVENQAVEEPQVDTSHLDSGAQFLANKPRYLVAQFLLHHRGLDSQHNHCVQTD